MVDSTFLNIAVGCAVLGGTSGALGCYAVLRREALIGDALAHAALPGIAIAFLVTGTKDLGPLLVGASLMGLIATWVVRMLVEQTKMDRSTALAVVLSSFFGIGAVLLSFIQKLPTDAQAGLDKFLFGQASALVRDQVILMSGISAFVLLLALLFYKELQVFTFDTDYARALGLRPTMINALLATMTVAAIMIGLNTVGVVLVSAMLVAPGIAARQWTHHLGYMMTLAAIFGMVSGVVGAVASIQFSHIPTGPAVVLASAAIVAISVTFGTDRGLFWSHFRRKRRARLTH